MSGSFRRNLVVYPQYVKSPGLSLWSLGKIENMAEHNIDSHLLRHLLLQITRGKQGDGRVEISQKQKYCQDYSIGCPINKKKIQTNVLPTLQGRQFYLLHKVAALYL